jgi:hypothetical protein
MKKRLILVVLFLVISPLIHALDITPNPDSGKNSYLIYIIPAGGLYTNTGQAGVASTTDTSYSEINPATTSFQTISTLSLYHNDYISDSSIEYVSYNFQKDQFGFQTSFKALHMPFVGYNAWGAITSKQGTYSESIASFNTSYLVGKNFNWDGISFGTTLKLGYRGVSQAIYANQSSLSLAFDVGALAQFNFLKFYASRDKNFSVGVSLRNLGWEFVLSPDSLPSLMSIGLSYRIIRPVQILMDFNIPLDYYAYYGAIGVNVQIARMWSMQAGLLIQPDRPKLSIGSVVHLNRINLVIGYTLDPLSRLEMFDRFSIGITINTHDTKALLIRDNVQEQYLTGLNCYASGDLLRAKMYFENALALDPHYNPAEDMLSTVNKEIELSNDLMKMLN